MFEEISLSLISEVQVWHLDLDKHERTNEVGWYSSILPGKNKQQINGNLYIYNYSCWFKQQYVMLI